MLRVIFGHHYVARLGGYSSKIKTVYYLVTNILCGKCIESEISMNAAVRYISVQRLDDHVIESASHPVAKRKYRKGNRINNVKHISEEF